MSIVVVQTLAAVCVGFVMAVCAHAVSERLSHESAAKRMVRRVLNEENTRLLACHRLECRRCAEQGLIMDIEKESFVRGACAVLDRVAERLGVGPLDDRREPAARVAAEERAP